MPQWNRPIREEVEFNETIGELHRGEELMERQNIGPGEYFRRCFLLFGILDKILEDSNNIICLYNPDDGVFNKVGLNNINKHKGVGNYSCFSDYLSSSLENYMSSVEPNYALKKYPPSIMGKSSYRGIQSNSIEITPEARLFNQKFCEKYEITEAIHIWLSQIIYLGLEYHESVLDHSVVILNFRNNFPVPEISVQELNINELFTS
jgi:hypothetical protein